MTFVRRVARLMLAWIFITGGFSAMRKPEGRAATAAPLLDKIRELAPASLPDDVGLVRVNGGVQAVAGVTLATDTLPRLSAFVLAAALVPTTAGGHPFWSIDDPAQRMHQRTQFNKNLAMLGGLLLAAAAPGESGRITEPSRTALAQHARQQTRSRCHTPRTDGSR